MEVDDVKEVVKENPNHEIVPEGNYYVLIFHVLYFL